MTEQNLMPSLGGFQEVRKSLGESLIEFNSELNTLGKEILYFLINKDEIVFIGTTKNIQMRLEAHDQGGWKYAPTYTAVRGVILDPEKVDPKEISKTWAMFLGLQLNGNIGFYIKPRKIQGLYFETCEGVLT